MQQERISENTFSGEFVSRIRERDASEQALVQHLFEVAELSERFASKIHLPISGRVIGLSHDLGKYSVKFQHYIRGVSGVLGENEQTSARELKGKIDHATAGAQLIWESLSTNTQADTYVAQVLAACIASHHTGLSDFIAPNGCTPFIKRMKKPKEMTYLDEIEANGDADVLAKLGGMLSSTNTSDELIAILKKIVKKEKNECLRQFHFGLVTRFLFSCLIDADRLSSANFENPKAVTFRNTKTSTDWHALKCKLEDHLTTLLVRNTIDVLRAAISTKCLEAAQREKGVFTLTVPTGGGKTFASLRFALHHAERHSSRATGGELQRIIYVVPYTSIIEQNAQAVRKILGADNIIEHHSNLVQENDTWRNRVLSDNWDAPIVFTTSVQFLNALFASSTSDVRRMHQLANAIIIFDEVQTLPIKTIHMFNNAINFLVQTCGSTVVLCTATQPLLDSVDPDRGAIRLNANSKIITDEVQLFDKLRRTQIRDYCKLDGWKVEEVAELSVKQMKEHNSVLVIVNTKKSALELYQVLSSVTDAKIFHLSTNMCPAHRKVVLSSVHECLNPASTESVICISTQLIEAGVDIDFGVVIRYLAGLDSIAQAAGRCNRHGNRTNIAPVFIVNPATENVSKLHDIQKGQEVTRRVLNDFRDDPNSMDNDLLSPAAMHRFYKYYFFNRSDEMTYPIFAKDHPKVGCDTTLLELLSHNTISTESYKRIEKESPKFSLRQAFQTAGDAFNVIDAPTQGIIVPYGEGGKDIIKELIAAFNDSNYLVEKQRMLLHRAQQYSVNVFPYLLSQLQERGCIYEVQKDSGIYCLHEQHYSDTYGISLEETMNMTFRNI